MKIEIHYRYCSTFLLKLTSWAHNLFFFKEKTIVLRNDRLGLTRGACCIAVATAVLRRLIGKE